MEDKNWIDIPELVGFNITSKCNLQCQYCFENLDPQTNDPSFEEVVDILNQLERLGVAEVLLEGGEIFCVPYIVELLNELGNYKFRTHIITNGTLINLKIATILSDLIISIGVSLDGPTEKSNLFRGKSAYDKAISAIKLLAEHGITTYVNCTVTKSNFNILGEMPRLCRNLGVYGLVFQQLHCSGKADQKFYRENVISNSQLEELYYLLPELIEKYPDIYFVDSEVLVLMEAPNRFKKVCNPKFDYEPKKIFRCAAGRRFCVIQPNLDIIPCGILGTFPCGNLRYHSFENIWKHSKGFGFIRHISDLRVDCIPGCEKCIYNPCCDGGCRGDMFNCSGDWLSTHIACPFTENEKS